MQMGRTFSGDDSNTTVASSASGGVVTTILGRSKGMGIGVDDLVKYGALVILVVQNSALALTMRYSRTVSGELYTASTAVVISEALKFFTSLGLVLFEEKSIRKTYIKLHQELLLRPEEMMKLLVPAILYTIQNNLAYIAVSNLDAASYQVLYQLKILTTAIFSVVMLRKQLDAAKWFALLILVGGVSLVQLSGLKDYSYSSASTEGNNNLIGLICVLLACCSSGFAGVYFEKVLKGSEISIWIRNIELAMIGFVVGLVGVYYADAEVVNELGFLHGYSTVVYAVIALQAFGGIIVALVVKYADNLLKGFATSISIVLSCFFSMYLFQDFHLSFKFILGTSLVCMATLLYSSSPATTTTMLYAVWRLIFPTKDTEDGVLKKECVTI